MSRPAHQLSSNAWTKATTQESVAVVAGLRCAAPIKRTRRLLQRAVAQRFGALASGVELACRSFVSERVRSRQHPTQAASRNFPNFRNFACQRTQITSLIRTVPSRKRGVAQRHQRGAGCGGRGGVRRANSEPDEWRCSVRRSRVVLTPRSWRQVCEKKRRRRCQTSLVTGESAK